MRSLEYLSGRFVSLVGRAAWTRYAPGEAAMGRFLIGSPTDSEPLGGHGSHYAGVGRGIRPEEALAAAIGEALERYSLRDLDDSRVFLASVKQHSMRGRPHIAPSRLAPVLDFQEEPAVRLAPPPTEDQPMLWVSSIDLVAGREVLLPAQYCVNVDHGPACRASHDEWPWYIATSNGTATGTSPASACLTGLLELLERDAFMLMWYHRLRFPFLQIDPRSLLGCRLAAVFGRSRLQLRLIDLTDIHKVPVIIAAVQGWVGDQAPYALGGGASIGLDDAIWKATKEVAGIYSWARQQLADGDAHGLRAEQIWTFGDHLRYYADPDHQGELAFLFEDRPMRSPEPVQVGAPSEDASRALRRLSTRLHGDGIDVYAVDITPADIPPLGLCVYKVVSPQLIPLDYHHQARHLAHERLLREPTRRGWRTDEPRLADLNHTPHPFP